ncbi:rod shape-determining protein MreC [Geosporobacter subterraneus DSM 17957]|uniref:Cell shape-determining protein MreC n=1 Tax=Geosporobacter subterraneus DSM 17957 TaxID=1121919 RepID=A0A1M6N2G1_9FIRM|nr:rod shape-determining protein MreC [Geosporobacter subterraneus]SHJ89890.1 rod shape-determining protein MreC [Geosporobacter subterraneus DSM 17957]
MKVLFKKGALMIVTAVTIILIIMMGMSIGGRVKISGPENIFGSMVTPVQRIIYNGGQLIENTIRPIFAFRSIDRDNKRLSEENEQLTKQLIELQLTQNELEELRNLSRALNYVSEENRFQHISASVTGKDTGNWFNIFTINVGTKEGVKKDSPVINGSGLIGRVYEVGDNWSKVITIIDNKSSVSFEILRQNEYIGVIRGSVKASLSGYLIDPHAEVVVGDKLITSGLSIYPKGILIGEIKEVSKKEDELLKTISVEPAVNFKKIDKVMVLISQGE